MVIRVITAVKDLAVASFGDPMCNTHVGASMRGFTDEVNRSHDMNMLNKHPEDFELYEVGTFDTDTGTFTAPVSPVLKLRGKDCVKNLSPTEFTSHDRSLR